MTIIEAASANLGEAIAAASVEQRLSVALMQAARLIPRQKGAEAVQAVRNAIAASFPGRMPAEAALAIVGVVAANALADLLMQIEPSQAVGNAKRDGRVQALRNFLTQTLEAAVSSRVLERQLSLRVQRTLGEAAQVSERSGARE